MASKTAGENGVAKEENKAAPAPPAPPAIPDWIQAELFEPLLKAEVPGFVKIKDFKAVKAMGAGENYATLMLRIHIEAELQDGKGKSLAYMMKVSHDLEFIRQMKKIHNIFDVERGLYMDIVPEFEEMYRQAGLEVKFGAKAYSLENPKDDCILLEDLSTRGFKNANRLEGLDMDHCKCVLKKIAQWHAASAVRVAERGPYEKIYTTGFFTDTNQAMMKEMFDSMATVFMRCITTYEGHEVYIEDVKKLVANQMKQILSLRHIDPNEFNVLNHGDCWSNNVMFQYDAFGKIKETYLVDYQIPRYGTPAQDLLYFILSSTKLELKLKQFDFFIKFYHDQLVEHLQLLKYKKKIPKLREIHQMIYKYIMWGYMTAIGVMAIVLLDPTDNASLENFIAEAEEGDKFKMMLFSNPRFKKHIEQVLPWLHNRGAMEC